VIVGEPNPGMITYQMLPQFFGQNRVVSYSSFPSWALTVGAKAPSVTNDMPSSYRSNELDLEIFLVNLRQ
jgi:hypothetical protein